MILLRIDPVALTLLVIAMCAIWLMIGYLLGYQDASEGAFEDYEEEV